MPPCCLTCTVCYSCKIAAVYFYVRHAGTHSTLCKLTPCDQPRFGLPRAARQRRGGPRPLALHFQGHCARSYHSLATAQVGFAARLRAPNTCLPSSSAPALHPPAVPCGLVEDWLESCSESSGALARRRGASNVVRRFSAADHPAPESPVHATPSGQKRRASRGQGFATPSPLSAAAAGCRSARNVHEVSPALLHRFPVQVAGAAMGSVPAEAVLAVLKQLSHDIRGAPVLGRGFARAGMDGELLFMHDSAEVARVRLFSASVTGPPIFC